MSWTNNPNSQYRASFFVCVWCKKLINPCWVHRTYNYRKISNGSNKNRNKTWITLEFTDFETYCWANFRSPMMDRGEKRQVRWVKVLCSWVKQQTFCPIRRAAKKFLLNIQHLLLKTFHHSGLNDPKKNFHNWISLRRFMLFLFFVMFFVCLYACQNRKFFHSLTRAFSLLLNEDEG